MASNEELLNSLVGELKPVRPLSSPLVRALTWAAPQVIIAVAILYFSSPIEVIYISNIQFFLQVFIAAVAMLTGAYLGFVNTIPGLLSEKKSRLTFVPFILLFVLVLINIVFPTTAQLVNDHRPHCSLELISLTMIGFVHNFYMLRKGFVIFQNKTILTSLLTSAMIPLIALYCTCSFSTEHIVMAHYLPIGVLTILIFTLFKIVKKIRSM